MSLSFDHKCKICHKDFSSWDAIPFCSSCYTNARRDVQLYVAGLENRMFQTEHNHISSWTGQPWDWISASKVQLKEKVINPLTKEMRNIALSLDYTDPNSPMLWTKIKGLYLYNVALQIFCRTFMQEPRH